MAFGSTLFVFIFLPISLAVYYLIPRRLRGARNTALLLISLLFYAFGEPLGVLVLLVSLAAGYMSAISISRWVNSNHQRAAMQSLMYSIVFQLFVMILFMAVPELLKTLGVSQLYLFPLNKLAFPIGVPFYSFQIIVFQIDIYSGETRLRNGFVNYALSVGFFGKLIYGPIVPYDEMSRQVQQRKESFTVFGQGVTLFIAGLAKKVLLADIIGHLWNTVLITPEGKLSVVTAWVGAFFSLLYFTFTFAAYAQMAEGLGYMFGFELPKSFKRPLASRSLTEFFRRFHVTVTDCFRRLLYNPMGGDGNQTFFVLVSLLITCIAAGLWCGTGVGFVIFGAYIAVIMFMEKKVWGRVLRILPSIARKIYMFIVASMAFALLGSAIKGATIPYVTAMFGANKLLFDATGFYYIRSGFIPLVLMVLCSTKVFARAENSLLSQKGISGDIILMIWYIFIFMLSTAFMVSGVSSPFIRFMML